MCQQGYRDLLLFGRNGSQPNVDMPKEFQVEDNGIAAARQEISGQVQDLPNLYHQGWAFQNSHKGEKLISSNPGGQTWPHTEATSKTGVSGPPEMPCWE